MRIIIITSNPFPHAGGQATHIAMLKRGLIRSGHEVDVVSYSDINKVIRLIAINIPAMILNRIHKGLGIMHQYIWTNIFLNLIYLMRYVVKRYELINLQNLSAYAGLKNKYIPQVLTVHGDLTNELLSGRAINPDGPIEKIFWRLEGKIYKKCDAIVTVDTRLKQHVKGLSNRDDVVVIKNFIDTDEFVPAGEDRTKIREEMGIGKEKKVFFLTRRLTAKNGVKVPLSALTVLMRKGYNNCMLVYAGDGELRQEMEKYVTDNGLRKNVIFLGDVIHSRIKALYGIADMVLIPSVRSYGMVEATSISAIEAMSMGIPVVASAIGGLKELIIDRKNGLLVEENNPEQLAGAIIALLNDERLYRSISEEARKYIIANHDYRSAANKFLEIYRKTLNDKHRKN